MHLRPVVYRGIQQSEGHVAAGRTALGAIAPGRIRVSVASMQGMDVEHLYPISWQTAKTAGSLIDKRGMLSLSSTTRAVRITWQSP